MPPAAVLAGLGTVLFVVFWEVTGRAGTFGRMWIPLSEIVDAIGDPARRALLERATKATFSRAAAGLVGGFALATLLASLTTLVPVLRTTVERMAVSLNAIPWIALGPLLMVTVSRDTAPAVISGLAVFFPAFTSLVTGLSAARRESLDLMASLGTPRLRTFIVLRIPSSLPMVCVALKLAAPAALVGAIFGEWFGAERGLGLLLLTSMQSFNVAQLWAVAFIAAGAAALLYLLFAALERAARSRFGHGGVDEVAETAAKHHRLASVLTWAALVAVAVGIWQAYVSATDISALLVPSPGEVTDALSADVGLVVSEALATLRTAAIGLALGTGIGALLAIAASWSPVLRGLLTPVAVVAHAVPTLALLPVIAGMLGYNDRTLLAIAVLISFFPGFVFTDSGLQSAPAGDLMSALGARRTRRFVVSVLPATVPYIAVALRVSAGLCVIAAVVAEFMIGRAGLGRRFSLAHAQSDTPLAWGIALVIVVLSMSAYALASSGERALHRRFT